MIKTYSKMEFCKHNPSLWPGEEINVVFQLHEKFVMGFQIWRGIHKSFTAPSVLLVKDYKT